MTMPPRLRKFALTLHVTSSVGLLGVIGAFLALAVTGLTSQNAQMVRAAYPAMQLIARFVVVPLAFASLLTGLIQSLGTPWGLFRHYWVLVKLLLTVFAATLREARIQLVVHAAGGLLVLVVPVVLSIYKPPGATRYGWQKQFEQQPAS